jgi:hypothetical protein
MVEGPSLYLTGLSTCACSVSEDRLEWVRAKCHRSAEFIDELACMERADSAQSPIRSSHVLQARDGS